LRFSALASERRFIFSSTMGYRRQKQQKHWASLAPLSAPTAIEPWRNLKQSWKRIGGERIMR